MKLCAFCAQNVEHPCKSDHDADMCADRQCAVPESDQDAASPVNPKKE